LSEQALQFGQATNLFKDLHTQCNEYTKKKNMCCTLTLCDRQDETMPSNVLQSSCKDLRSSSAAPGEAELADDIEESKTARLGVVLANS